MPADLHLHSVFSDGTFTPKEIVERACSIGLDTLALTDHDTVGGWGEMKLYCQSAEIRWVPGIELSTSHAGREIHLLGYFSSNELTVLPEKLGAFQERRRNRVQEIIIQLRDSGVHWDVDQVYDNIECQSPGRPHVARALVEHGVVSNVSNAFRKYLVKDKPGWVPSNYPSTVEMIQAIHADHGLAVLAHPGLGVPNEMLTDLASQGLDGVEVFHTAHKPSLVRKYRYLASKLKLKVTGGSDCHGHISGGPRMGKVVLAESDLDSFLKELELDPISQPTTA
ncbi:MAG: PHP domain-containing protein [Verrucomicrobia bacterium]|jgi:3',5'-nucleoside bisphosphate phosphatase|nr:PHP domain-containing protein [Verrucomicrobiota bacterium]